MTNRECRRLAEEQYQGWDIKAFVQSQGSCDAWVALWLRKRSRGKDIWSGRYLFEIEDIQAMYRDGITIRDIFEDDMDDYGRPSSFLSLDSFGKQKTADLHRKFGKPRDDLNQPMRHLKSGNDPWQKVPSSKVGGSEVERDYIRSGSGRPAGMPPRQKVLKFCWRYERQPLSSANNVGDCKPLKSFFKTMSREKAVASIGLMADGIPHAVGLDCSAAGETVYFDPLLGEVKFPDATELGGWWADCFGDRRDGESAWEKITDTFWSADCYKKTP